MHLRLLWDYEACLKVVERCIIFCFYARVMKREDTESMKCVRKTSNAPETSLGLRGVFKSH